MELSTRQYEILVNIFTSKRKNPIKQKELVKNLDISAGGSTFKKIKDILIINNVIREEKTGDGNTKILYIDYKELDKLIYDSDNYKISKKYIVKRNPLTHNI